jgi:hypothetical protein
MMKTIVKIGLLILLGSSGVLAQFNGQRAFSYLVKQVAFGPRNPGSKGHQACLKYLQDEMGKWADLVDLQSFTYYDRFNRKTLHLTNVIARFNPRAQRRIFFAAHWDTRPFADRDVKENRNTPIPGANDGASGVAVLLEMARVLKAQRPTIGVDLILFDGEDYGKEGNLENYFLGSKYFAKHYAKDGYKHEFGILIDMIGDAQLTIKKEGYSVQSLPWLVDKVWNIAHQMGFYEFSDQFLGYVEDDHVPLLKAGIPCIDLIDFEYPDKSNRYWHTLEDTPDKCSPQSLYIVGSVLLEVAYEE